MKCPNCSHEWTTKRKPKAPETYGPNSPEVKLYNHCIERIRANFPRARFDNGVKKKSLDMFNKLLRIDRYKEKDIAQAIFFATDDNEPNGLSGFCWANQFQSPLKLRKKDSEGVMYVEKWIRLRNM